MSLLRNDTPLFLPPGTVRSLLVLGLTVMIMFVAMKSVTFHEDIPPLVADLLKATIPATVLLIERYITTRNDEEKRGLKEENTELKGGIPGAAPEGLPKA